MNTKNTNVSNYIGKLSLLYIVQNLGTLKIWEDYQK